jgi:hypothetical protein
VDSITIKAHSPPAFRLGGIAVLMGEAPSLFPPDYREGRLAILMAMAL